MRKFILLSFSVFFLSFFTSCNPNTEATMHPDKSTNDKCASPTAQHSCHTCTWDSLQVNHDFYRKDLEDSKNESIKKVLQKADNDLSFIIFLGTWCGDSKRITPRFFSYLKAAHWDVQKKLSIVCVEHNMQSDYTSLASVMGIKKVPTIIVLREGKETARIVEYSVAKTTEGDLMDFWEKSFVQALH